MDSENPYVAPKISTRSSRPVPRPSLLLWAMGTVFGSAIAGVVLGWVMGFCIGTFSPGYYEFVFPGASESPDFEPISLGIGLGMTQGAGVGVAAGLVIVVVFFWYQSRVDRKPIAEPGQKKERHFN